MRYHDCQIDYYGQLYQLTPALAEMGVTFDQFIDQPQRYMDTAFEREQLRHIYDSNPGIEARGILFETFVQHPDAVISLVFFREPPAPPGIDAESIESELVCEPDCRLTGSGYRQPLHHHSYAVSAQRTMVRR